MNNNIITQIRRKFNITQEELAHTLNVSYTSVNAWEAGKRVPQVHMQEILQEMMKADNLTSFSNNKTRLSGIARSDAGFISSVIDYNGMKDLNPYTHNIGRWFGSLPSFLVKDLLNFLLTDYKNSGNVLVNFSGSGTVSLEAGLNGRKCFAIDANPMAILLGYVKTQFPGYHDIDAINNAYDIVFSNKKIVVDMESLSKNNLLAKDNKWVSKQARDTFLQICSGICILDDLKLQQLFAVALSSVVVDFCNIDKRCTNHYVYKESKPFVISELENCLKKEISSFLDGFSELEKVESYQIPHINLGDACDLTFDSCSMDLVFSHPPYGTTINYFAINKMPISILETIKFKNDFMKEIYADKCQSTDISSGTLKRFNSFTSKWVSEAYRVIKPGGMFLTIIGDSRDSGKLSHPFTDIITEGEKAGFIMKEMFIWITNHKSGMHVKRKGNHIDHNYIIIMEKPENEN